MSRPTRLLAVLALHAAAALGACGSNENRTPATPSGAAPVATTAAAMPIRPDRHSYANVQDFVTRHLVLDLSVDFEHSALDGVAELRLKRLNADATELVLDTRALQIKQVHAATASGSWVATNYHLDPNDPLLGSALHIAMPAGSERVRISYRTSREASGLQWLTPAQTAGKNKPFLFTQSESIHARSWVPLQDTPGVRITYEAQVHTPRDLLAVMSAENEPDTALDGDYHFSMPQPIPSYLLALAVGDLRFAATGARTGVYAEPSVLAAAAREFEDTPAMLEQAEKLYGPYRWGRYDLLILPPSFPFGGMENPRLTFATPTVIVGDKSLVSLVAHELAHSWSGNLVTNATWRDFWLNESFTSYLTNRIMEAVYGRERGDMERSLEADELRREISGLPVGQRMLVSEEASRDPDEIPSIIAYNRGSLFLYNLEQAFGRDSFDRFLKAWFDEHAFTSQTTEDFVAFLDQRLLSAQPGKFPLEKARAWIYDAELPADAIYPASAAFAQVDASRAAWLAGRQTARQIDTAGWNVLHWTYFLDGLPATVSTRQLEDLDAAFQLTASRNHILLRSWLPIAIAHDYHAVDTAVQQHLMSVGRTYLITAVYRALVKTEAGRARAQQIYREARPGYHPITQAAVEKILAEPANSR